MRCARTSRHSKRSSSASRLPEAVEQQRGDVEGFAAMFPAYRLGLADDDAVDFDGQIAAAIETLLREPGVRADLQRECRHLLVDEFQDLRPAHLLLVRLAAVPCTTCSAWATTTR